MKDDAQTYWIMEPRQLAEMASARRQDILDRLAATGPLSIKELAAQIGARPSALYHHIEKLLEVELIVPAGWRTVHRKREQLYAARAKRMRMLRALAEGKQQPLMETIVASLARQMERDFRAGGTLPSRQRGRRGAQLRLLPPDRPAGRRTTSPGSTPAWRKSPRFSGTAATRTRRSSASNGS